LKMLVLVFFAVFSMGCEVSSECRLLKNHDHVMTCMAVRNNNLSYCYRIKDRDKQSLCFARITKIRDYCEEIKNKKDRSFCYVMAQ